MKIVYIDHYDSFSFNVIDWLQKIHQSVEILYYQYDNKDLIHVLQGKNYPIVLSPGPKSPCEAHQTIEIVSSLIHKVPILGVCLGHQILGHYCGMQTRQSAKPIHGVQKEIKVNNSLFLPDSNSLILGVYNSLVLEGEIPESWKVTGYDHYQEIQMIENWQNPLAPAIGIQAHPESFLSDDGKLVLKAWGNVLNNFYKSTVQS